MATKMNEWVSDILLSSRKMFLLVGLSISILIAVHTSRYGFLPTLAVVLIISIAFCGTALVTLKILIPKLLINRERKRYIFYYLFCSMFFMAFFAGTCDYVVAHHLHDTIEIMFVEENDDINDIDVWRYFMWMVFAFIVSNVFAFRRKMQEDMRQNEILSIEKKEMEMKILKSQINTHFLHNALNNIYSMIYFGNKDEAAKYVLKLSQMLRYVLDYCEADRVPMEKEVAYIENYIDFQKARFETDKDICFNYIHHSTETIYLPPMIFQPLIENCFKYCPLDKADTYVHIDLEVDNSRIRFVCENTKNAVESLPEKGGNGIGIKNLDKRLHLSYGENYKLNISDKETVFRVDLIINFLK